MIDTWRAGFVRRWHTSPDMVDCGDTVATHHARCGALALRYWPDDANLLRAAITHDMAECIIGDLPFGIKQHHSYINVAQYEKALLEDNNLNFHCDPLKLRFIDRLDAYLYVRHVRPHVLSGDGWPQAREWLVRTAADFGVELTL